MLDNTFYVLDITFLHWINPKRKRIIQQEYMYYPVRMRVIQVIHHNKYYPTRICVNQCEYVISNVNKCNPTQKCVIEREYALSKVKKVLCTTTIILILELDS